MALNQKVNMLIAELNEQRSKQEDLKAELNDIKQHRVAFAKQAKALEDEILKVRQARIHDEEKVTRQQLITLHVANTVKKVKAANETIDARVVAKQRRCHRLDNHARELEKERDTLLNEYTRKKKVIEEFTQGTHVDVQLVSHPQVPFTFMNWSLNVALSIYDEQKPRISTRNKQGCGVFEMGNRLLALEHLTSLPITRLKAKHPATGQKPSLTKTTMMGTWRAVACCWTAVDHSMTHTAWHPVHWIQNCSGSLTRWYPASRALFARCRQMLSLESLMMRKKPGSHQQPERLSMGSNCGDIPGYLLVTTSTRGTMSSRES